MTCRAIHTSRLSITARTSAAEKARFASLAHAAGIPESALALMAIRAFVDAKSWGPEAPAVDPAAERLRATDRITIRLRPGDGAAIARRARERGVRPATYLAAMARAHVVGASPIFTQELATLKQSITVLAGLATILAQSAYRLTPNGQGFEELRQVTLRTSAAVTALEQCTHDFTKVALVAWESRFE